MPNILLIEDDLTLAPMVCKWLTHENHSVEHVTTGTAGRDRLFSDCFDMAIVDWELPELSGPEICRAARERGMSIPILMLTGRLGIDNIENGLTMGADDYLTKPFAIKELSARIKALLRRADHEFVGLEVKARDVTLIAGANKLLKGAEEVDLTPTEYALIEFLLRNPNRVFSKKDLLDHVWSSSSDAADSALTSCIKRLRQKIDAPGQESLIKSVYGGGYKLEP